MLADRMRMAAGAGASPVEATYITTVNVTADQGSPKTFSAVDIGAADAARYVVTGFFLAVSAGNMDITSVTVGGVASTKLARGFTGNKGVDLWITDSAVASGTTADVVIAWSSGTGETFSCSTFRVLNPDPSPNDTISSTASPPTGTINCPANGAIIGYAYADQNSTYVWTGITEQVDQATGDITITTTGACDDFAAEQSGLTVTATPSAGSERAMVAASFGPA